MVDGASLLMTMFYSFDASGFWKQSKESNLLDGGAHFYDTFECKDRKHMSVGSIEPQFYEILIDKLELDKDYFGNQMVINQGHGQDHCMYIVYTNILDLLPSSDI